MKEKIVKEEQKFGIKFYQYLREIKHQILISQFGFSSTCHQNPSCSQYTSEEIKKNGTIVGLLKGSYRAIRCKHS